MCKICSFLGEFFTVGGQENIYWSASRSDFVAIGPAKILKIGQQMTFSWPKYEF